MVVAVHDIDVAGGIHSDALGAGAELGLASRAIGKARHARAGQGGDDPAGRDLAEPAVARICHVDAAVRIDVQNTWRIELSCSPRSVGVPPRASARKRTD